MNPLVPEICHFHDQIINSCLWDFKTRQRYPLHFETKSVAKASKSNSVIFNNESQLLRKGRNVEETNQGGVWKWKACRGTQAK